MTQRIYCINIVTKSNLTPQEIKEYIEKQLTIFTFFRETQFNIMGITVEP